MSARKYGEITTIVEPDSQRRGFVREQFGADVEILTRPDDVDVDSLDAACITSPDHTHAALAVLLLRQGVGVFVEKPLDITTAAADAVLRVAYDGGGKLYIGHNMRHMAVVLAMRDIIMRGDIGQVKAIWCRHFVGHGGDFYFKDWHAQRRNTGGLLLHKEAHDIDVIHWLAGGNTQQVVAMGQLGVDGELPDRRDNSDRMMEQRFSHDNWPPTAQ